MTDDSEMKLQCLHSVQCKESFSADWCWISQIIEEGCTDSTMVLYAFTLLSVDKEEEHFRTTISRNLDE